MSALHSRRGCWCGERHSFEDVLLLNFDHLQTVADAAVLGEYERDFSAQESEATEDE